MKYLYNPATDEFESLTPTLRERFSLGSKDPTPGTNTDGEVAGALMDAFPNSSFLKYQNAVEEGFQGTFEEFLRDTSDKSELDMKAIEGQTAGALPQMLIEGVIELTKKSKKARDPSPSNITATTGKKIKKFKDLDEGEQEYADLLLQNFKKITKNPQTKDIVPEKYKNIKDIRELVSDKKAYSKFITDLRDIQYKKITDEKDIDKFSKLPKTQQNNVKSLLIARNKSASLPKTNFINIAGDDFSIPNNIGVLPSQIKNLEKAYPLLKKLDKNPTVDNFYKNVTGQSKGGNVFINDIQAYLSGVDTRTRPIFDKPVEMQLLKSLDLENKLKPETIKILTEQKGKIASNRYKLPGMSEKAKKITLDNPKRAASVKRIDEIYKEDPNISSDELVDQYYGDSFAKASIKEQKKMLGKLRNDVVTYYKIINQARVPVKGVRLPSAEKRAEILDSIESQKGKDGFNIYGGHIRDIQNKIAESVTGYNSGSRVTTLSRIYSKKGANVDHSVGLGAVHEVAPGYAEAIQIIKPSINKQKGRVLERPLTAILNDFFSNTKNKARKIGDETYSNFDDKVAAYNNLSKEFADQNGIDTAIIKFSKPGTGPSPKETVTHFTEFSEGARKNMMEVWNNHGLVIYTKSKPMRSESFAKTYKTNKNMGGIIEPMDRTMMAMGGRVGFQDGTPDLRFGQILSAFENTDLIDMLEKENKPSLKEEIYGDDGERNLIQTFNTMFADPKAYPYYAQELASGAANIPELAVRFPTALAYLFGKTSLATTTGDLSKIGVKDLKKAVEILDPKATKFLKEKIGFTDMLEKSREERTGPQRRTGGLLEIGAESVGPATPYFLIKAFPKIAKQVRNLVGTAASADKVNREIENKMASQGVDQGRRDILLAAGAGGAMALLKYLGLDNLIKTTKVVKAAPEIITKGGAPKYFFDFVSLIKSKGDDITETASTLERQKVYDYKGYTMYEDISTGEIRINKTNEGMASGYDKDGEIQQYDTILGQEEIMYKPPETIVGKDGKAVKTLDEYEEATAKPDSYGDMEGEAGLDSIDEILELLLKDGKKYSKTELKGMGIDIDALGNYPSGAGSVRLEDLVKPEKAEGGIISGVKSGPPPKSGKTPHGLPYVAKNVRPIKERN